MAKNTGKGHRVGAVRGRSEFKHNGQHFKRDPATGRILNGSAHPQGRPGREVVRTRPIMRRAFRRAAAAPPALGGALIVVAVLLGQPVDAPWQ